MIVLVLHCPSSADGSSRIGLNSTCVWARGNGAAWDAEEEECPDLGQAPLCFPYLAFFRVGERPLLASFLGFFLRPGDGERCQDSCTAGGVLRTDAEVLVPNLTGLAWRKV